VVIIDALDILCAQLTRDPFAIAKFLFFVCTLNLSTDPMMPFSIEKGDNTIAAIDISAI